MDTLKMEDLIDQPVLPSDTPETTEPTQDPLEQEYKAIKENKPRSKKEKLEYTLRRVQAQLKELDGEPSGDSDEGLEETEDADDEDSKPLTKADLKKILASNGLQVQTAKQMAEKLPTEAERELVKHYLDNVIRRSGDEKTDFDNALALVNARKAARINEELLRKGEPKTHSSASSAPPIQTQNDQELTKEEIQIMQWSGLTKEQVLKARQG